MRGPYVIDRVTVTQAISGRYRFQREVGWRGVVAIGSKDWSSRYELETPELLTKAIGQRVREKIERIKWSNVSLATVKAVLELVAQDSKVSEIAP